MKELFKTRGTVEMSGMGCIVVREAGTERPVMLRVYKSLSRYLDIQSSSDMEEKYMDIDFVYTSWCTLAAILVPSTNERIPAKVIFERGQEGLEIFGEQEIINTIEPKPMSREEWDKVLEYAETNDFYRFENLCILAKPSCASV